MAKNSVGTVSGGQLWQVPVFLLGCASLAGFFTARPLWNNPVARATARLDHARRLWERGDSHTDKILSHVRYYLDNAGPEPGRAAEAQLIQGSVLLRAARRTRPEDQPPWQQAHEYLLKARELGVSADDAPKLLVSLGETTFHLGNLDEAIALLSGNLEAADDKAAILRILVLAHLSKKPADLEGALSANERLRQLPLVGEDVLSPARLQGGEILLRLHRPSEARKLLEKITPDSPEEILVQARILRARSHQDESQWNEAAALWQETLDKRQASNLGELYYNLGLCRRRLEQRDEAIEAWRAGVKQGEPACALGVGELLLAAGDVGAAQSLTWAVRGVRSPEAWTNPYLDLKQTRELFEQVGALCRQKQAFEQALSLTEAYERLAAPGMAAYQRGLALREWGRALGQGTPPERGHSVEILRRSGVAFEKAAEAATNPEEKSDRLWQSASGHLEGDDPARAVTVLLNYVQLSGLPAERAGEGWYLLATAHERLKEETNAEAAYRRCISYRSKFAHRARFRLSEIELSRGKIDRASGMLELNLQQLRLDPDDESLERTLYALGHLLIQQRKHAEAQPILKEAVTRYPRSSSCPRGRFDLAETYRLLAVIQNQNIDTMPRESRQHFLEERKRLLTDAAEQYELLSHALTNKERGIGALTRVEQVQVPFSLAECRFNLGDYSAALKLYAELADRHQGKLEGLSALGGTARCFAAQRDFDKFRSRLDDIRVALKSADQATQREWEQWLSIAGKGQ